MKSTGVIRRIDELGRIVIPKEIRRNLRMKDGENLEIFVEDNETILLKKHSILDKFKELSDTIVNTLSSSTDDILITDTNRVISYSGKNENDYLNKPLNNSFFKLLDTRKKCVKKKEPINIANTELNKSYIIEPLILNGDLIGSIVLLNDNLITSNQEKLIDFASKILINYIEE